MEKSRAENLIKETFEQAFEEERYGKFITELFNGQIDRNKQSTWAGSHIPNAFKEQVNHYKRLGTYTDPNGDLVDLLIVYLKKEQNLDRARTMQRNFIAHHLNNRSADNAIVAFVVKDAPEHWRFSFVRRDVQVILDGGKLKQETILSPVRRYSFLVGVDEGTHTAQQQIIPILQNTSTDPSLEALEKAFNIETVTKEFFDDYKGLFLDLNDELDSLVKNNADIKAEFEKNDIEVSNFAKKLLGQIVFLYFLQKKGWMGVPKGGKWGDGDRNFLSNLFDAGTYKNYFMDILEPLFYKALAEDRTQKDNVYDVTSELTVKIPFLNGGLFEPMNGYKWENKIVSISNERFKEIFEVFNRYNFTVREDEPLEKEVAVDPEMLGKVFENLLEVNDRKSKGAFYTPREIVHYMCQESLINYLDTRVNRQLRSFLEEDNPKPTLFEMPPIETKQPTLSEVVHKRTISREDIATFICSGEFAVQNDIAKEAGTQSYDYVMPETIRSHAQKLDEALADIKICDPAIGSGAFPVGMMQEIIKAREVLTTYIGDDKGRKLYNFKRQAIEHSIYGVDIDAGAIDIAKLRLWLSLVVDEDNYQDIQPLPNLDYKIVCGNALLSVQKDLFNLEKFQKLEALKTDYFNQTDATKKREQRTEIDAIIGELTDDYSNFDIQIYFSEVFHGNKGFDIVIGNPPYLESRSPEFLDDVKDALQKAVKERWKKDAKFIARGADLLIYFFESGIFNIHAEGQVVLITQNSWLDTEYGNKFQNFLLEHTYVEAIIDSDYKYFNSKDGPNINTVISIFKGKKKTNQKITFARFKDRFQNISSSLFQSEDDREIQSVEYYRYSYADDILTNTKWGILLASPPEFLELLPVLKQRGILIDNVKHSKLSIGQGLNLTKNYFLSCNDARKLNISSKALIPFVTSADGAPFDITKTDYFLIDKKMLSQDEIKLLKPTPFKIFDRGSTRKIEPILVLPRGIGRHFCAINNASAFSASYVDIYDAVENPSEEVMLNLWLFLNSSVAWLIREISGRKNLGGGMLKAEAVDLKSFPIYMDFNRLSDIQSIRNQISTREALDTMAEIETNEHKNIDTIVFDYLGIDAVKRVKLVDLLRKKILARTEKSQT
ncbi:MAG: hypothetical protein Phog2KO_26390 [Phototrophicaceae bacterium]